jgi:hypothetical protein
VDEINELKRSGMSIQAISELTGYDRKTIRKYLLKPVVPEYRSRPAAVSKLEPFKPYLSERMQAGVWNAQVLLRELRERNYTGGYTILKDWLKPQRESAQVVAVRRFETPQGKQAQVDWGHLGSLAENGDERKMGFCHDAGLQPDDDGGSGDRSEVGDAVADARDSLPAMGRSALRDSLRPDEDDLDGH